MAFRSARVNADESAADRRDSATAWQDVADSADSPAAGGRDQSPAPVDAFGVEPTETQRATLQRAAKEYGHANTRQWAAEGMSTDAMGTPSEMVAFRERQQDRPSEVPHDIEQHNEASLHRNTAAHRDHEPADQAAVPDSVREIVSEPGQQLEGEVKAGLEGRLDASLDHVQIHTGPTAQQACEEVNAARSRLAITSRSARVSTTLTRPKGNISSPTRSSTPPATRRSHLDDAED